MARASRHPPYDEGVDGGSRTCRTGHDRQPVPRLRRLVRTARNRPEGQDRQSGVPAGDPRARAGADFLGIWSTRPDRDRFATALARAAGGATVLVEIDHEGVTGGPPSRRVPLLPRRGRADRRCRPHARVEPRDADRLDRVSEELREKTRILDQATRSHHCPHHVAREKACGQSERRRIDLRDGVVQRCERYDRNDGCEDFIAHHAHLRTHVGQNRRAQKRTFALTTFDNACTIANRVFNPFLRATRLRFADHRADDRLGIVRVAHFQAARSRHEERKKFIDDFLVDEQSLNGRARLACTAERRICTARRRAFEIGIVADDRCRDTAELECDGPQSDGLLNFFADTGAAGKCIKGNVRVGGQPSADFRTRPLDQVDMARRQAGVEQDLHEQRRAQWC